MRTWAALPADTTVSSGGGATSSSPTRPMSTATGDIDDGAAGDHRPSPVLAEQSRDNRWSCKQPNGERTRTSVYPLHHGRPRFGSDGAVAIRIGNETLAVLSAIRRLGTRRTFAENATFAAVWSDARCGLHPIRRRCLRLERPRTKTHSTHQAFMEAAGLVTAERRDPPWPTWRIRPGPR